ncbi:ergothioneine biosynthesis protein EgtB [Sciscionella sediminilitoris]|uniref:ergothioneine biosynthesis protein EgtB n=1 Tax=Sciscionella sediminilitoris TaxID=1445613 RepID=UPI0004DF0CE7|nr:ergothioneine biosynthesis protein EgtB [Sciscionella sp. SE31]
MNLSTEQFREDIATRLRRARERSTVLTDIEDAELTTQHSTLMSPLVWDLAHIGNQEELWLLRDVGGREPVRADIDELYNAFEHPRAARPSLPLLGPDEARGYVREVRAKVLDVLEHVPFEGSDLHSGGFAFGMIIQHEQQHDETMLATHQLRSGGPVLRAEPAPRGSATPGEVLVEAGPFEMGTSVDPWSLDNERPAHRVWVDTFAIDRFPVTCGEYRRFVEDGGYRDPRWWSERGWAHRCAEDLTAPAFWFRDSGTWLRRRFGEVEPVPAEEPVVHVCFFEAQAYARWAGKRLPTEAEWEKAARWDPRSGRSTRFPWGDAEPGTEHANLGQRHLSPAGIGAYPDGESHYGVAQLIGDVWEWCDSDFAPYPEFRVMPYKEYSAPFFGGDYKMLRGGSFGTDVAAMRSTFRNWDHPIRRQIFSGFRLARSVA